MKMKLDSRGMKQLLMSDAVRAELRRRAQRVADRANSTAPVGETGQLSQSHEVVDDTTDRAVARVVSDLDYAITVEANTGYLTASLDAAGGAV
jgi:hypothetical protein